MFIRPSTIRKNGKKHVYWQLVRSVRHGSKTRKEVVAHLGELDAQGRAKASALAKHFLGERAEQPLLFEPDEIAPEPVRFGRARVERSRVFGNVWLAWLLWRTLELDRFCESVMDRGREKIPWSEIAAILVIARLCEPSSELHIAEDWYRRTALEDLLGIDPNIVHHTRLYQGLDQLLPHKKALEIHLKNRLGSLFAVDFDILLYDVTSTYFEGQALRVTSAARGYSRDHRPDCKQVCIGLVVTFDGYPLGYEIFAGNRTDVTTVEEIVEEMELRYGRAKRVWVMDRGMVSEENLAWLNREGRKYLVGTPRSELRKWERDLLDQDGWQQVRDGLEVKLCSGPDGEETFILCRSADRQKKEQAMHDRFAERVETGLKKLARRLACARRPVDRDRVLLQLGRLLERNARAAQKYTIRVEKDESRASLLRLDWHENKDWSEWAKQVEGTYILRSNVNQWTAEDLWNTYTQLTEAEAAFRIQKSDLQIRPIWHQTENRVRAHILVCFLAYVMWKTLQGWQERAGLGSSPRTVLKEMAKIQSVDVVLPLVRGPEMRLRCVVRPDKDQAALLDRLGLELPRRLRVPTKLQSVGTNSS